MLKYCNIALLGLATLLWGGGIAQASSPQAENIFATQLGTSTIDKGGAIHSQTRSIYSLGGGMTSFQGKRVSLLAVDPPSFSAGCHGISWHFGGLAFINAAEISQLVESIAQASLGLAVDLAMQTICPQCYAVMTKLRDMAASMRNASVDACQVAHRMEDWAKVNMPASWQPDASLKNCSLNTSDTARAASPLQSQMKDGLCSGLASVNTEMAEIGTGVTNFLNGTPDPAKPTPSKRDLDSVGNYSYETLTALGYEDGFIKDLLLSYLGMTIKAANPSANCAEVLKDVLGSSANALGTVDPATATADQKKRAAITASTGRTLDFSSIPSSPVGGSGVRIALPPDGATAPSFGAAAGAVAPSTPSANGAQKGLPVCRAPPTLSGMKDIGRALICGYDPIADMATFISNHGSDGPSTQAIIDSGLGILCSLGAIAKEAAKGATASQLSHELGGDPDPLMYHCGADSARCMHPTTVKFSENLKAGTVSATAKYSGLAWYVMDALYSGVDAVKNNQQLPSTTVQLLNGSGYPLYRLLNLAAVYPGQAGELLEAYGGVIAVHYAMDTLTQMLSVGTITQISMESLNGGVTGQDITAIRAEIMNMLHIGGDVKESVLKRLSEKRTLVDLIVQVNKALQADVFSSGLSGNANLALSIKQQMAPMTARATTP